ncbi:MAG: hypothetical protein JO257_02345 [Deltaproteobacteria bacterium]|nr:hypothetical protein [Deltaproteobacteria bacterium]
MRKFSALLLLAAACGTDPTTPTASGVFPAEGFTGRTLRVEISGDATTWKDGATVDFGTGVTVNAVTVASPTDLFADITIDPAAAEGKNDVTVNNGGKKYTLTKAFELVSPTPISWSGDVAQGGVPFFTIENLDFSHQFDTTSDPNTGAFTNTTIMGPPGTDVVLTSVTPFEIQGQVFIDVNAPAGTTPLTLMSGKPGAVATSQAGTIDIKARSPMPFTGSATVSLAEEGSSQLFSYSATGATLIHYTLSGNAASSSPVSEVLASGGTWTTTDELGASPVLLENGGMGYILVENFGTSADTVTMSGGVDALTSAPEGADATNGSANGTTVLNAGTLPFRQTGGMLSSANDVDFVKFTAPTGSTGKHLHVTSNLGSDANTNSVVEVDTGNLGATVFEAAHDDDSNCSLFGCTNLGEDFVTSGTVTAGSTYWIKVSASPGNGFDPPYSTSHKAYTLVFWLE